MLIGVRKEIRKEGFGTEPHTTLASIPKKNNGPLAVLGCSWYKGGPHFFFPSFASAALARSSHSVVLMNELAKCMKQRPSLRS